MQSLQVEVNTVFIATPSGENEQSRRRMQVASVISTAPTVTNILPIYAQHVCKHIISHQLFDDRKFQGPVSLPLCQWMLASWQVFGINWCKFELNRYSQKRVPTSIVTKICVLWIHFFTVEFLTCDQPNSRSHFKLLVVE